VLSEGLAQAVLAVENVVGESKSDALVAILLLLLLL
jgi:hypothetical protein